MVTVKLKVTRPVYSDYKRETTFKKPATGLFPTIKKASGRGMSHTFLFESEGQPFNFPLYVKKPKL